MSKNRNRARLKKAKTNREYKNILINILYPPYYDEGWYYRKGIFSRKYREYRSWKYNRKTKYRI